MTFPKRTVSELRDIENDKGPGDVAGGIRGRIAGVDDIAGQGRGGELGRGLADIFLPDAHDFLIHAVGEPNGISFAPDRSETVKARFREFGQRCREGAHMPCRNRVLRVFFLA